MYRTHVSRRMLWASLIFITGFTGVHASAQSKNPPLTNDDVIRMTKEELDESIIIRAIQTSETNFDTTANGLIQLKRGKVKKNIIELIQRVQSTKSQPRPAPASSPSPNPPGSPQAPTPAAATTPVATKIEDSYVFEIERCYISGTTVRCNIKVKNHSGEDRQLRLDGSTFVDNSGHTSESSNYKLGVEEKNRRRGFRRAYNHILRGGFIQGWIKFEDVQPNTQSIGRLTVRIDSNPGRSYAIEFRDVPLEK